MGNFLQYPRLVYHRQRSALIPITEYLRICWFATELSVASYYGVRASYRFDSTGWSSNV